LTRPLLPPLLLSLDWDGLMSYQVAVICPKAEPEIAAKIANWNANLLLGLPAIVGGRGI
jgi:hypothetical protein